MLVLALAASAGRRLRTTGALTEGVGDLSDCVPRDGGRPEARGGARLGTPPAAAGEAPISFHLVTDGHGPRNGGGLGHSSPALLDAGGGSTSVTSRDHTRPWLHLHVEAAAAVAAAESLTRVMVLDADLVLTRSVQAVGAIRHLQRQRGRRVGAGAGAVV